MARIIINLTDPNLTDEQLDSLDIMVYDTVEEFSLEFDMEIERLAN